ncbi:MAG: succinyldiaminopimelate transaminase [Pseudomonadota bacterium]|nr:succinyldiaminopimelate transaminase [Pseudomonadota bacterium]
MNPGMQKLHPYPFEKLADLTRDIVPSDLPHIALTIGEPKHQPPVHVLEALVSSVKGLAKYPTIIGLAELRKTIAGWVEQRFDTRALDPHSEVLPVNGTREGLFAIAQALVTPGREGAVVIPNPFYQIYEGAALLAGVQPTLITSDHSTGLLANYRKLSDHDWEACQMLFLCTPGNPSGAVIPESELQWLIQKAIEHDVILISDECYSELYYDEAAPPIGLLQAADSLGNSDFKQCLAFHSLSKRSNLPGLRSGFVAGDAALIQEFRRYRTYHGCAMPLHHQLASVAAWSDEAHVEENRALYRAKFDSVNEVLAPALNTRIPEAGFYLWANTPTSDIEFARTLLEQKNVAVLPGSYLGREVQGRNPGSGHVRMALVATHQETLEAAERIADFIKRG